MTSISFIINTYNRARYLPNTLRGLSKLDHDQVEVVVVNGPSTDNTESILRDWASRIKIGHCPETNLSQSRNVGIALASGEIIAFIDDDAVPHPQWAKQILRHYADTQVGGVGGFTVDNTGVRYQVCKTICDRFGNAYNVSNYFDERPLNQPGSFYYPSLLGTNSSFRASALHEIGGFDETFRYLLDETDVCLRLVDADYKIVYEPAATIFHQFAPSHIRSERKIARTLYPSAVSKSYFIHRHGARASSDQVQEQVSRYQDEILRANTWLAEHGDIPWEHKHSLDRDLLWGIENGAEIARSRYDRKKGDLLISDVENSFKRQPLSSGLRIAMVSRGFPPSVDAGIARWTKMMSEGLAARGHEVHVICEADGEPSVSYDCGVWIHRVVIDVSGMQAQLENALPPDMAGWAMAVDREVAALKSFGLDVVSFPIWDLEGFRCLDMSDVGVVMSLHTSYALAKQFKPEWSARPIFEHLTVTKMIALEASALARAPVILANSEAIIRDMEATYGVPIRTRTVLAPHGTYDPLSPSRRSRECEGALRVAFVGRFERRKGFDIAARACAAAIAKGIDLHMLIAGDKVGEELREELRALGCDDLLRDPRVEWRGHLDRENLDDLYASVDVVLMPSRYESFGLVAIEAMAAGATVIALDAGGLAEVVEDGVAGFLVTADEAAHCTIADKIALLARDRETLTRMQGNARAAFEARYTVERMIEMAEAAYLNAAMKKEQARAVNC